MERIHIHLKDLDDVGYSKTYNELRKLYPITDIDELRYQRYRILTGHIDGDHDSIRESIKNHENVLKVEIEKWPKKRNQK